MKTEDFNKLKEQIERGQLTPSQMEDLVYAMHAAYVDHFDDVAVWIAKSLEETADEMLMARTVAAHIEADAMESEHRRKVGYVHTVENTDGVSVERMQ